MDKSGAPKTDKESLKKAKKELKRKKRLKRWFGFLRFIYGLLSPIFPFKRYGHKKRYDDREYVIVCNHLSFTDVFPCGCATHNAVHFIAKSGLEKSKIGKWFVKKCQCILVNRDGTDVGAIMQAMRYLKGGESVVIFPEGTRNKTSEIFQPFKSGAAALAIKTQTPIIPVVIVRKLKPFRLGRVYYGEPLEFTEYYGKKLLPEDIEKCDNALRQKMLEMYHELNDKLNAKKKKK